MQVSIKTIPHNKQRYNTVGDWQETPKGWTIRVSSLSNWKYEFLVGLHELAEMAFCMSEGISQEEVDNFDFNYKGKGEPGNDPECPYARQHLLATLIEKILAWALGVNWQEYEKELNEVIKKGRKK